MRARTEVLRWSALAAALALAALIVVVAIPVIRDCSGCSDDALATKIAIGALGLAVLVLLGAWAMLRSPRSKDPDAAGGTEVDSSGNSRHLGSAGERVDPPLAAAERVDRPPSDR